MWVSSSKTSVVLLMYLVTTYAQTSAQCSQTDIMDGCFPRQSGAWKSIYMKLEVDLWCPLYSLSNQVGRQRIIWGSVYIHRRVYGPWIAPTTALLTPNTNPYVCTHLDGRESCDTCTPKVWAYKGNSCIAALTNGNGPNESQDWSVISGTSTNRCTPSWYFRLYANASMLTVRH